MKKKTAKITLFLTQLFLLPSIAYGVPVAGGGGGTSGPLEGKSGADKIVAKIGELIGYMSGWAAAIFVIVFIVGGLMYITSAGNPQRAENGKKALTAGLVGAIIILFSKYGIKTLADLLSGKY